MLYGPENTTSAILKFLLDVETKLDICADSTWPSVAMGIDVFRNALIDIKKRRIRRRYITTITKNNLSYCKEVMKIGELRHLDGIRGNFAVSVWLMCRDADNVDIKFTKIISTLY